MKRRERLAKHAWFGLQIVFTGGLTGLFAGIVITFYNILCEMAEDFSRGYYDFFRREPAFIPLLFAALFLGAVVIGGTLRALPFIRGSGIPQTEGAMRGLMRFAWFRTLTGMFAASLFTVFMGLSAGAEGPSVIMGGACGAGVGRAFRRNIIARRYELTAGACAALAVAFNAPVTGLAFAFEEGHRRFTPEVFLCSFASVITAVVTRNVLRWALGLSTGAVFTTFSFSADAAADGMFYLYVLLTAAVCALAGAAFYYLLLLVKKLFGKIGFWKGMGRMLIPFLLAGAAGLITVNVMGGGHAFIESLGSGASGVVSVFSLPLWATLLIVAVLKFAVTLVNMGAGVPCGAFVPMLAIGAGLGALMSLACRAMGMDPAYSDALILIAMSAFFTSVVRAPVTGIVMAVELTWSFAFALPLVAGVAVGYAIGAVLRVQPLYDRLLEDQLQEAALPLSPVSARFCVRGNCMAAGRSVRDILWPAGVRACTVERGGQMLVAEGGRRLAEGDVVWVTGESSAPEECLEALAQTLGDRLEEPISSGQPSAEGVRPSADPPDREDT